MAGKQYTGTYPGEVVDVNDPEKRCRVKVNVFEIFQGVPIKDLPWANFQLPLGSRAGEGTLTPLHVGDQVFVFFVGGDSRRPVITGCAQAAPEGKVNLPSELSGNGTNYQHKRTAEQPSVDNPGYYEDVTTIQNNSLIQLCKSGAIRVTQMASGSSIEIGANGDIVLHTEGNLFISATGNCIQTIDGDFSLKVKGEMKMSSQKSASYGSETQALNLHAATQGTMTGDGGLALNGPTTMRDTLTVNSDINATGSIMDSSGNSNHHSH